MTDEGHPTASIGRKSIAGLLWTGSSTGLLILVQLGVLAALARLLTPADFGVAAAGLVIVNLSNTFTEIGVTPALIQMTGVTERHVRSGYTFSLILGIAMFIAMYLSAGAIEQYFHMPGLKPVCQIVAISFVFHGAAATAYAATVRNLHFHRAALVDLFGYTIGYVGFAIPMAWLGYRFYGLAVAPVVQEIFEAIVYNYMARHSLKPLLDGKALRELAVLGGGFSLVRIFMQIATMGDAVLVGHLMGASALGLYSRAYQMTAMPATLYGRVVERVVFPAMARLQDERARLGRAFLRGVELTALIGIPINCMVAVLAPQFVRILLGPKWGAVVPVLAVLGTGIYFRVGYRVCVSSMRATGRVYWLTFFNAIYAACVLGGVTLTTPYGLPAVAGAIFGAITIYFLLTSGFSMYVLGIRVGDFVLAHRPGICLGALSGGSAWIAARMLEHQNVFLQTAVALAAAGLCALLAAIYARPIFFGNEGERLVSGALDILRNAVTRLRGMQRPT